MEADYIAVDELNIIILLFIPLIIGIVRGTSICMLACAPGIVPYLVAKQYDWRKCLQLAVIFNIPRIIVLSILGIVVGIIGFYLKDTLASILTPIFIPTQVLGYGMLGIFILLFGAYMFTTSIEKREDLKEVKEAKESKGEKNSNELKGQVKTVSCSTEPACQPRHKRFFSFVQKRFKDIQSKPRKLFLLWGGILSIACLGEIIAIELSIISGAFGVISDSIGTAALLGGFAMFSFAIGASIPVIIVATFSSSISNYFKNIEKLETIRTIGAIIMIMVGLVFLFQLVAFIVSR
jgi:cytochrome c biogenesis protein CcdA